MSVILEDLSLKVKTQAKRELSFDNNRLRIEDNRYRDILIQNFIDSGVEKNPLNISSNVDKENLLYISDTLNSYSEFFNVNGVYKERVVGLNQTNSLLLYHPKVDTSLMFDLDGNLKFEAGYIPPFSGSPVSKDYTDIEYSKLVIISNPQMDVGYSADTLDGSVYTKDDIDNSFIYLRLPTTDPLSVGAIWNNNGVVTTSNG